MKISNKIHYKLIAQLKSSNCFLREIERAGEKCVNECSSACRSANVWKMEFFLGGG